MSQTAQTDRLEVPIEGMDCAECCAHVRRAIASVPGVVTVDVFLASEKAVIEGDPQRLDISALRSAVENAGYKVADARTKSPASAAAMELRGNSFTRSVLLITGFVFGAVLFIVVIGEWLGLFATVTERVPWPLGIVIVLIGWYPVLRHVVRAALRGQILAHTLMSLGVLAALAVGEWATAAVVVFFMRVGDYVEKFTAERARRAVKDLARLAPQTARILRNGHEQTVPIEQVKVDDIVVVRPGEQIPVDGDVVEGQATVDQATITGESIPVEASVGSQVFAATIAQLGSLRIRTVHVGADTTFGRVIRLVEEAEANRADVQRLADRFSTYFLPFVAAIAVLTFLLRRDPLATAAVLVVACSCSIALATPIAVLAAIGGAARRGLLIKGGKYLELLAEADILLIDKTGTLTLGQPRIIDIVPLNGQSENEILAAALAAEQYSEHPLAEAVRQAGKDHNVSPATAHSFQAVPGQGVRAWVDGVEIAVGSPRLAATVAPEKSRELAVGLEESGKTLLYVSIDGCTVGLLAAADTSRVEVPEALHQIRHLGIRHIELLTGDNRRTAAELAHTLDIKYRAELLPEDKMAIVKAYQADGHVVVMIGDGVNDAPALAQADVGIAMGAAGSDIAVEAAHVALMLDDWRLVPDVFHIARRTMDTVKLNLGFTAIYNIVGLGLAVFGFLPPILAAAAQSLPDLGVLANSSRLLHSGRARCSGS